jgi:beta propeller repeat protein
METKKTGKKNKRPMSPLYALVYTTRSISVLVFVLLVGFVLQPVEQALASEETATTTENNSVAEETTTLETSSSEVDEPTEEIVQKETEVASDDESLPESTDATPTVEQTAEEIPESVTENNSESVGATETDDTIDPSGITDEVDENSSSSDNVVLDNPTSSDLESTATTTQAGEEVLKNEEVLEEVLIEEEVEAQPNEEFSELPSEEVIADAEVITTDSENITPSSSVIYVQVKDDPNQYIFDKTQCVSVGNGSFHCTTNSETVEEQINQTFSTKGNRGNLEIFITTKDGTKQITENDYDDSSPKYDQKSQRLVWQRLIDGRQQIIVYDLEEEVETQLTFGSENNMEPAVSGKYIVWQHWDSNDWEIMFYDGKSTKQITDNESQDIAPVVDDSYVIWTSIGSDTQMVKVYSIETGGVQTISDHEGGAIVNPRFVLLYDTKMDNGDVITRGFDPETGLSSDLAATPRPEPIDIPSSDSTGETRALIQNKPPQREDFTSELDDLEPNNNNSTSSATSSAAIEVAEDLLITSMTEPATSTTFSLTEYDLVVTPITDASSSQSIDGGQ